MEKEDFKRKIIEILAASGYKDKKGRPVVDVNEIYLKFYKEKSGLEDALNELKEEGRIAVSCFSYNSDLTTTFFSGTYSGAISVLIALEKSN